MRGMKGGGCRVVLGGETQEMTGAGGPSDPQEGLAACLAEL